MSGMSVTFCPGLSSAKISAHSGLQVTVTKRSGLPNSLTIAIESWNRLSMYLGPDTKEDGKINIRPVVSRFVSSVVNASTNPLYNSTLK